jgi:hypothetical protein
MRAGRPRKIRRRKSSQRRRSLAKRGIRSPKQVAARNGRNRVRRRKRR